MKGPMTTLTLRGLVNQQPYHWRGDKPRVFQFQRGVPAIHGR